MFYNVKKVVLFLKLNKRHMAEKAEFSWYMKLLVF